MDGAPGKIPKEDRAGVWPDEFDRLTEIRDKREAKQRADQNARNDLVDAETQRLRAENERFKLGQG